MQESTGSCDKDDDKIQQINSSIVIFPVRITSQISFTISFSSTSLIPIKQISADLQGLSMGGATTSTNIQAIYTLSICASKVQLDKLKDLLFHYFIFFYLTYPYIPIIIFPQSHTH